MIDLYDRYVESDFILYHLDKLIERVGTDKPIAYYTQSIWREWQDYEQKQFKKKPFSLKDILEKAQKQGDSK